MAEAAAPVEVAAVGRRALAAYALVTGAGVLWGSTFSLARLATAGGADPIGLTFWQGFGGGVVLLALCALSRRRVPLDRTSLRLYVVLGLVGTAAPAVIFFHAAPRVPAGVLAITIAAVPMITYSGSWWLRIDVVSRRRLAGLAAGLVGIVLLLAPQSSLPERSMAPWVLIVLLASVFYSVENIYVAMRVPPGTDMLALLTGMLLASALMLAPVTGALDAFVPLAWPWTTVEKAILAMAVVSSIAYAMYLYAIHMAGPVFASQTGYVITVSGVLWGMAFFDERHSHWVWAALAAMLAGMTLVTPRRAQSSTGSQV